MIKKRMVGLLLFFTMLIMIAGGCERKDSKSGESEKSVIENGKPEETVSGKGNGRFFESEVPLPNGIDDINSLRKLSDGTLMAVGENKEDKSYFILKSKDKGKKWKKTKINGIKKEYIPNIVIAPDGGAAFINYAKDGKIEVNTSDEKGNTKSFYFSFPGENQNGSENQVSQAAYDNGGKLIVMDTDGLFYTVKSDGTINKLFDTKGVQINYFSIVENTLMAVYDDGIYLFNTDDGKMSDNEELLDNLVKNNKGLASLDTDSGQPMVFSGGLQENSIFFANENGIYHFTKGGTVVEQLLDGSLVELGAGDMVFQDMVVIDKENILIAASSSGNCKIFSYSYDDKAASAPNKELTVYALDESNFLRKAVTVFQKKNPDVHVNLEIALSGDDGVTLEDALSTLNTNILANKGPDVLVLDGMPMESYIEKGMLEDISNVVDEVDKADGIFKNIKEGSKHDGKIYAMPTRFLLSIVEGNKKAVASGGSLPKFADMAGQVKKKNPSVNFTSNKGTQTLLRDLYYADSATWQKEDGTIDSDSLTEYLRCAKMIYDLDSGSKDDDTLNESGGDGTFGGLKIGTNIDTGLISNDYKVAFGSLAGFHELQTMCSTWGQTKANYALLNSEKEKSYIPYLTLGVTTGGNTDIAKEFVKTVLGKKAGNDENNGFPVNKSAFEELGKEKLDSQKVKDGTSLGFSGSGGDDKVYGFDYVNLTQNDVDKVTKIAESVNKPAMTNRVIQELVLDEGDKYLLGKQNLENTVDAILKKVNLYLSE